MPLEWTLDSLHVTGGLELHTLVDEGYAVCLQAWQLKCGYNYTILPPPLPTDFFFVGDTFVFLN